MIKMTNLKNPKILVILAVGVLTVAVVLFNTQPSSGGDVMSEAIEGGELTLTSVGRNYESVTQFVQDDEAKARQLLDAALQALENARAKLNSAARTSDEYVLGMLSNYQIVAQASEVMAQGVENLLKISQNLANATDCYSKGDYEQAAEQAAYCFQILTPLLDDFKASNETLNSIDFFYIPSGQRDRLTLGINQYRSEMEIYYQYVALLRTLFEGRDYMKMNQLIEEYLRQLQDALSNTDYKTAQEILQKIAEILKSLRDPSFQIAADAASELDPSMLKGMTLDMAEELLNRLRNLKGIEAFEDYLKGLEKYLEALRHLEKGEYEEAEQAANEGLGALKQDEGVDPELQGLYAGLREAFHKLTLHTKGQPEQG